jgi:MbtH protein
MSQSHTNPFESESASYRVLVNDEGQHSLWPDLVAIPAGWRSVFGPDLRAACLSFITESWTDLRPAGLLRATQTPAPSHKS